MSFINEVRTMSKMIAVQTLSDIHIRFAIIR